MVTIALCYNRYHNILCENQTVFTVYSTYWEKSMHIMAKLKKTFSGFSLSALPILMHRHFKSKVDICAFASVREQRWELSGHRVGK